MIGSFMERYSAKVCYGGGGGGGGGAPSIYGGRGGPKSQEQAVRDAQRYHSTGSFANPAPSMKREACAAGAGILAGASYVPHPAAKVAVVVGSVALAYACY